MEAFKLLDNTIKNKAEEMLISSANIDHMSYITVPGTLHVTTKTTGAIKALRY